MENLLAWWLEAISIPAITLFGLIGNILTFIVLARKPPHPTWTPPASLMLSRSSIPRRESSSTDDPCSLPYYPSSIQSASRHTSPRTQSTATSSGRHYSIASRRSSSTPDDGTYLPPLTTRFLLKALAIADSLILLWPCFIHSIVYLSTGSIILFLSISLCKVGTFFNYFLMQLSPWLLVLVTMDRVYNIVFPTLSRRKKLTRKHVKILFILTMLILALINLCMLFGLDLKSEEEMTYQNSTNTSNFHSPSLRCLPKKSFKYFITEVWSWIDFVVAFGLPFVILVIGNILVLIKMKSSENFRSRSARGGMMASPRAAEHWAKVSAILGLTFIVLVMPLVVFQIGGPYWFPAKPDPDIIPTLITLRLVLNLLLYINSAINFVLYMLLGSPKLRQQFVRPLHDCKRFICKCTSRDE